MARYTWLAVVGSILAIRPNLVLGQAPLPSALIESTFVYLTNEGVDRGWLDRAAEEVEKIGRFELVGNRSNAELVFVLTRGASGDPFFVGGGNSVYSGSTKSARFIVQDPATGELLWDDSRDIHVFVGGAVADLVKDLHKRIENEEHRVAERSSSTLRTVAGARSEDSTGPGSESAMTLPIVLPVKHQHGSRLWPATLTLLNGALGFDEEGDDSHDFVVMLDRVSEFDTSSEASEGGARSYTLYFDESMPVGNEITVEADAAWLTRLLTYLETYAPNVVLIR